MAQEEQVEEEEQEQEEQGVYLLDLAASIFAIMLIYLLIVASQVTDAQQKVDIAQYKSKDTQSLNFPLQTWRPLNTHRNHWILQNGTLWHMNFAAIAKLFNEKGAGLLYSSPEKGKIFVDIPPKGSYPTEFSIRFEGSELAKPSPNDAVLDHSFPLHTVTRADGEPDSDVIARFAEPFTIHVVGEPGDNVYRELHAIEKIRESCVVYFHEGGGFGIDRLQLDYALSKIYR